MAVELQYSFDNVATADLPKLFPDYNQGLLAASGAPVGQYSRTNYGGGRCRFTNTLTSSMWFHCRMNLTAFPGTSTVILTFGDATVPHVAIGATIDGCIYAARASGTAYGGGTINTGAVLGTGTQRIALDTWFSVAGEILVADSGGTFKTWINGVADLNLSALDTRNGGTEYVSYVHNGTAGTWYLDDLVVGTGASPNGNAVGELRVDAMMPNANGTDRANGGSGEMTRSTGSDDYTLINETNPSADVADYLYADAVGEKASVNVAALTNAGGTIVAAQCTVYAQKNEAGPCGFKIYCLRGGSRYYSGEFFPSFGSWQFFRYVWNQDPSTSAAWTESNFNAAEFGVERTT